MQRSNQLLRLLLVFILVPVLVALVTEAFKTHLVWYFRIVDFADLVILAPTYVVLLVLFHEHLIDSGAPRLVRMLFLVFAGLFLYGHAMHVTGNAINTFSTEIRDYIAVLPSDTYALIYFLDETLSHIIMFLSLYSLFACMLVADAICETYDISLKAQWLVVGLGIAYGLAQAIASVEGGKVWLVPIQLVVLGVPWLWLWRRSTLSFQAFLRRGAFVLFVGVLLPSQLISLGLYAAITGGFVQPSQLGF